MKKLIALCLCLVLSVLPAFALKGEVVDPDDLPYIPTEQSPSDWAVEEIKEATGAGLVPALPGDPSYQAAATREQFAALAVTLAEKATGKTLPAAPADTFTDTQSEVVRKAYQAGIVNGMAAVSTGGRIVYELVFNIDGKEFFRTTLDDLRAVQKSNPEVARA